MVSKVVSLNSLENQCFDFLGVFLTFVLGLASSSNGRRFWKFSSKTKNLKLVAFSKTAKFKTMRLEKCEGNIKVFGIFHQKLLKYWLSEKKSGIRIFFKQTVQTTGGRNGCCKLQESVERVYHLKIPVVAVRIEPNYYDILICTYYMTFSCFELFY